jgi:hypothetical protein
MLDITGGPFLTGNIAPGGVASLGDVETEFSAEVKGAREKIHRTGSPATSTAKRLLPNSFDDDDVYLDKNNKQGVLKNLSSANMKRRLQPMRHK